LSEANGRIRDVRPSQAKKSRKPLRVTAFFAVTVLSGNNRNLGLG